MINMMNTKRPLLTGDVDDDEEKQKCHKKRRKCIDLSDVPPQLPILKSHDRGGSSKYEGVYFHFNKSKNKKWTAQISIDGKQQNIDTYDNEEKAAVDYARAVHKYRYQK